MCGRFTLSTDLDYLLDFFSITDIPSDLDSRPNYNIAPSQPVLAVTMHSGHRHLNPFRWGLIPNWSRDSAVGYRMINARAETLMQKKSFAPLLPGRRLAVLADGFYEWKREGNKKQPFRIALESGEPFAMAGLWDRWKDPEGRPVVSCTIITTQANELVRSVHERMPVLLTPEGLAKWLEPKNEPPDVLRVLNAYDPDCMRMYPVSPAVNSPKNNDETLIQEWKH